jgi:hypothetical protein
MGIGVILSTAFQLYQRHWRTHLPGLRETTPSSRTKINCGPNNDEGR